MTAVHGQGDAQGPGPGGGDADGVGLEGAPRHDDVVALVTDRAHQVGYEGHRASSHHDAGAVDTVALGKGVHQGLPRHLGVAVGLRGRCRRGLDDLLLGRVGQLVAGELDDVVAVGAGTGHVGGQGAHGGTDMDGRRGGEHAHALMVSLRGAHR